MCVRDSAPQPPSVVFVYSYLPLPSRARSSKLSKKVLPEKRDSQNVFDVRSRSEKFKIKEESEEKNAK